MECVLTEWTAAGIMVASVIGGIIGGYITGQIGTAALKSLWPSRQQQEGATHPLATIVGLIAFCLGFIIAFLLIAGVLRGLAC